jgi:Holliday junction resolvasome RuvABC endonuclease subunit
MGLDLSLTGCGIVVLDEAGVPVFQRVSGYSLKRTSSVREKVERLVDIAIDVISAAKDNDVSAVGIEGHAFASVRGTQYDLGELHGVVKTQLWLALQLEPVVIAPMSARKMVFGSGKMKKREVMAELSKRGLSFTDHNEGDAYVIAEALRRRMRNE